MSRTVEAMSLGAMTKPPTTTTAIMKTARSANLRLSRNISATRPAIPTYRLCAQPPSILPRFSPTRSPSPAAIAGVANTSTVIATPTIHVTSLRIPSSLLGRVDCRHVPAVAAHQPHPVGEREHRLRLRVASAQSHDELSLARGLAPVLADRVESDELARLRDRSDARRARQQVLEVVGVPGEIRAEEPA